MRITKSRRLLSTQVKENLKDLKNKSSLAKVEKRSALDENAGYLRFNYSPKDAEDLISRMYQIGSMQPSPSVKPQILDIKAAFIPYYYLKQRVEYHVDSRIHYQPKSGESTLSSISRRGQFSSPFSFKIQAENQRIILGSNQYQDAFNEISFNDDLSNIVSGSNASSHNLGLNFTRGVPLQMLSHQQYLPKQVLNKTFFDQREIITKADNKIKTACQQLNLAVIRTRTIATLYQNSQIQNQLCKLFIPHYIFDMRIGKVDYQIIVNANNLQLSSPAIKLISLPTVGMISSSIAGSVCGVALLAQPMTLVDFISSFSLDQVQTQVLIGSLFGTVTFPVILSFFMNKYVIKALNQKRSFISSIKEDKVQVDPINYKEMLQQRNLQENLIYSDLIPIIQKAIKNELVL